MGNISPTFIINIRAARTNGNVENHLFYNGFGAINDCGLRRPDPKNLRQPCFHADLGLSVAPTAINKTTENKEDRPWEQRKQNRRPEEQTEIAGWRDSKDTRTEQDDEIARIRGLHKRSSQPCAPLGPADIYIYIYGARLGAYQILGTNQIFQNVQKSEWKIKNAP